MEAKHNSTTSLPDTPPAGKPRWNYRWLTVALAAGVTLQLIVLPCRHEVAAGPGYRQIELCGLSEARVRFALLFDALWITWMLLAYCLERRGRGWIVYALLMLTSPLWIVLATWLAVGGH